MKKELDITKFRKPTEKEIEQIAKNVAHRRKSTLKICRISSCICFVLAIFMFCGVLFKVTNFIMGIILGFVFMVISLSLLNTKRKLNKEVYVWTKGDFVVTDGLITKVVNSSDLPGWLNVLIVGNDLTKYGWHTVRQEGVRTGTKVLLAHPILQGKIRANTYAFTEFMLTNEGTNFF